jgi:hypothetical protein
MKTPGLFVTAVALALASVAARADALFFTVPVLPGPSSPRANPAPPPRPLMPQPSVRARDHLADREQMPIGEPDEAGRIAPSVPSARGDDGKLLPTHRPR